MKKLYEIVAELETQLATCTAEDYPRVCVELCKHLSFLDDTRNRNLLNEVLINPIICKYPNVYIEALLLTAAAEMNQMNPLNAQNRLQDAQVLLSKHYDEGQSIKIQLQEVLVYLYSNKVNNAIELADQCLQRAIKYGDNHVLSSAYNIGTITYMEHDQAIAGDYAFNALRLSENFNEKWLYSYSLFLLAFWSLPSGKYEDSKDYYEKALTIFEDEGADEYIMSTTSRLANLENKLLHHRNALEHQFRSLEIAQKLGNQRLIIDGHYSIAVTLKLLKRAEEAEKWFQDAITLAKSFNNKIEEATAYSLLGNMYLEMGEDEKAIYNCELALETYGNNIRPRLLRDLALRLNKLYKRKGNLEKAYDYLEKYVDIKLKLQDEVRIKETTKLQQLYEKEKRETELRELTIKQQQTELQQAESELKAIRAQMNPHFIFNALNTIQSYIYLNDKQNASNYLGKFSRLTRMILDMSNHEVVSLKDELEALTLYLQLERMRFEEVLTFKIEVAEVLDTESIKLPAMLIQPYIENAIKHGLLHKKGNRELHCSFELMGANLVVSVDDNGIGRQRSMEMNAAKGGDHKSFATQANAKRFSLLHKRSNDTIGVVYTDKTDAEGQPTGTLVVLTIPGQFDGVII